MEFVNTMRKQHKLIMGIGHKVKSVSGRAEQEGGPVSGQVGHETASVGCALIGVISLFMGGLCR